MWFLITLYKKYLSFPSLLTFSLLRLGKFFNGDRCLIFTLIICLTSLLANQVTELRLLVECFYWFCKAYCGYITLSTPRPQLGAYALTLFRTPWYPIPMAAFIARLWRWLNDFHEVEKLLLLLLFLLLWVFTKFFFHWSSGPRRWFHREMLRCLRKLFTLPLFFQRRL